MSEKTRIEGTINDDVLRGERDVALCMNGRRAEDSGATDGSAGSDPGRGFQKFTTIETAHSNSSCGVVWFGATTRRNFARRASRENRC